MDTEQFQELIGPYTNAITVDLGTGDGRFVYESARRDQTKFFIGIDANRRALAKISEKIYRRPEKGGAPNALFLEAGVEQLPEELDGVASEIYINFPWGSLLAGVMNGDQSVLRQIRRLCRPAATIQIAVALDRTRDITEVQRLAIPEVTPGFVRTNLQRRYEIAGFAITAYNHYAPSAWPEIKTTWSGKLHRARSLDVLVAKAI